MSQRVGRGFSMVFAVVLAMAGLFGLGARGKQLGAGSAARTGAARAEKLPSIAFEKYKLKNGLEVILSEDHTLPLVSVDIWYHVGPAYEVAGRTGFAHLFEHMMFEGSQHVGPKAHFRYLEAAGATGINATTSFDRTNYFETVPSNQLELALWLESDRMGYLLPTLDQEKLTNQRDVVRNERRQTRENAPYGVAQEELFHQLFPKGHPYYGSVMGSHADIEAVRLNDVREFFKQYYTPNNASLSIAGDFDRGRFRSENNQGGRGEIFRDAAGGSGGAEAGREDAADHCGTARGGDRYGGAAARVHGMVRAFVSDAGGRGKRFDLADSGRRKNEPAVSEPGARQANRARR
jgi:hypothetical protein